MWDSCVLDDEAKDAFERPFGLADRARYVDLLELAGELSRAVLPFDGEETAQHVVSINLSVGTTSETINDVFQAHRWRPTGGRVEGVEHIAGFQAFARVIGAGEDRPHHVLILDINHVGRDLILAEELSDA